VLEVKDVPRVMEEKCTGCSICALVCPTLAIKIVNRLPLIDEERCIGCTVCESRCPEECMEIILRTNPVVINFDISNVEIDDVFKLCRKAKLHPEQLVCFCLSTRAKEVAAAILKGAKTPDAISLATGIRGGCTVACVTPMLRLLQAAGVTVSKSGGWAWYSPTPTIWDVRDEVKTKYENVGYKISSDIQLINQVVKNK